MSYLSQMNASPLSNLRRNYRSDRTATTAKGSDTAPRVRFSRSTTAATTPLPSSHRERERRKRQALEFLQSETGGIRKPQHTTIRQPLNTSSRVSARSNRLGNDIPTISSKSVMYDDNALRNLRKESLRHNPLLSDPSPPRYTSNRTASPSYSNSNGLLNSLGKFGSKVLSSILYSEDATMPYGASNPPSSPVDVRSKRLDAELQAKELELQVAERKRYLQQLNEEINGLEKLKGVDNMSIDKQIGNLDHRLQNILEEVNSSSNAKLLSELESIKEELTSLRRKQETNNIKFESKFEDMMMENQISRQKFDKLYKELEEKRKNLDIEKNTLIRLLKDSKELNHDDKRMKNDSGESTDDRDDDGDDGDGDYDDDDDDDAKDILRYLMKHRRKKNPKSLSRLRQIRNNLNKIEKTTSS
ncbi:hypothetical protein CANINC_000615 [Pichia inconspicua]|uniref:Uncharacterized protein n=1 Tax=Pichia inconspicua TaxID=52247 RepID=A0A4T0X5I1_9ASCO|nr:hypothetical protein CANINC_000615 [[Candida] inconspicua]